ncbi:MAG: helix-turn-helix domain-containing protein [Acetobacteraceae bacterium]
MSWALDVIGWPARELARRIHTNESSVRQMLRGRRGVPDVLGIWLETLAQMMIALPVPFTWREKVDAGDGDPPETDDEEG